MNQYVEATIFLLSGLGILLVGFKMLSENIEKNSNRGLKKLLNKTSKNPFVGVGIGALVTAIIQSSAASTVMVVGFVNAGIISLFQAAAMIMGANIGTTITAQIVALGSFDISLYAMLLSIIGIFMYMIMKKEKYKSWGLAICGLGLVFIALWFMQFAMSSFKENEAFVKFLANCNNPFLLLLFGILFTAIIQSSSAITTILISMVSAGLVIGNSPNGILFVILGSNIGTTITALLSSFGANSNAKRASFIHLLFNFLGALIFFIILISWPSFMEVTFARWFKKSSAIQIAMFHTFFNLVCTLLFLPLINVFVKLSQLVIKDKKKKQITYLDEHFLKSPIIAIAQAKKEVLHLGKLSVDSLIIAIDAFIKQSQDEFDVIRKQISEISEANQNLLAYLVKLSSKELTDDEENTISQFHKIINDFYREVEIADNMIKYTEIVIKKDLSFSQVVIEQIQTLKEKIKLQYENLYQLSTNNDLSKIDEISKTEDEIDALRSIMISQHIERLEKNECSPASSGVFINLVSNLERAADHLNFIAQTVISNDYKK